MVGGMLRLRCGVGGGEGWDGVEVVQFKALIMAMSPM